MALDSANIGKKACEKAPSAKRRLKKLGILNATKNASVSSFAPKSLAIMKSLMSPKILDRKVIAATILLDLIKDLDIIEEIIYSSAGPRMMPTLEFRIHSTNCITSRLSDSDASRSLSAWSRSLP